MTRREKRRNAREKREELRARYKNKRCSLQYLRIAPRKVRAVVQTIRGRKLEEALAVLDFTYRAAAKPLATMLRAALANASSQEGINVDALIIKEIQVEQGPILKRYMPRAQGRATLIQKKTSHVKCLLEEKEG